VSKYVKFSAPDRLKIMDLDYVFAANWKHPDNQMRNGGTAVPSVPSLIPPENPASYLLGELM